MKKILLYFFITIFSISAKAQFESVKDSVVQLYGIVMTSDSLQGLPAVSVVIRNTSRGTMTNDKGVFSIVVLKGDEVEFSSVGYKSKTITIPATLVGDQYSVLQLMTTDTAFLPATIIKARPTPQEFARDFVNTEIPADQYEQARQNTSEAQRRILATYIPKDGGESYNAQLRTNTQRLYYAGQQAPIGLFNPASWGEFIKAWKRGDFKRKKS
jgi:hypothetical protein